MLPPIVPAVRALRDTFNDKPGRPLTKGEVSLVSSVYGSLINYGKVQVVNARWNRFMPEGRAHAPNGNVYFDDKAGYLEDFSAGGLNDRSTFVHEMGHVWQVQRGENVILNVPLQHSGNNGSYKYGYIFGDNWKMFEKDGYQSQQGGGRTKHVFFMLKLEAQAEFVSDYYRIRQGSSAEMGANKGHARSEYERLMPHQLRATAMGGALTS